METLKKNKVRVFFIVVLLITACRHSKPLTEEKNTPNYLNNIFQRKILRVAMISNSVNYFIYKGEPMGFQYELAKEFAKKLEVDLQIITKNSLQEILQTVDSGYCDLGATDITKTFERDKKYYLTKPYGETSQVLVQKKTKSAIKSTLGLAEKTIHVIKSSSFESRLNNLMSEIGDSIYVETIEGLEQEQIVEMLVNDEIIYTVADKNMAKVFKLFYPELDVSTEISFPQQLCWVVPQGADSLQAVIDEWLISFRKTKKRALIYNKYFKNKRSKRIKKSNFFSEGTGKISVYDELIKQNSSKINWDWRLLASLMFQESKFDPNAKSWAGAYGLMQLMPKTAKAFGADSISFAEENINAGIKYIKFLEKELKKMLINQEDLRKFILAAYNAGVGHIEDARNLTKKYGKDPDIWDDNVDFYMEMKSNPKYYKDPIVKYGYCRGKQTTNYVDIVLKRYEHYKNLISE